MSGTLLVTLAVVLAGHFERAASERAQFCIGELMVLECSSNEAILMTSAQYGRMEIGRCITKDQPLMGCSNNVLPLLDRWCSGQQECDTDVPNADLEKNSGCRIYLQQYLDVEYNCVSVASVCNANMPNELLTTNGFISSHVTKEQGCGTAMSPWIISAKPGQTINITLIDFSAHDETSGLPVCNAYGYIIERPLDIKLTICGENHRERVLYISETNNVEIVIINSAQLHNNTFMIGFEVIGCADLSPPTNAWYTREGSEAVIGCDTDYQQWRFRCIGNTWLGDIGNCSEKPGTNEEVLSTVMALGEEIVAEEGKQHSDQDDTEISVTVALLAAITGGVFVLVVIAIVGVVSIRRAAKCARKHYKDAYRPVNVDLTTI